MQPQFSESAPEHSTALYNQSWVLSIFGIQVCEMCEVESSDIYIYPCIYTDKYHIPEDQNLSDPHWILES